MKKFIRENPTIAFGLGLPLLLVVMFLLIAGIPSLLVPPPQYDVIYATQYYNYPNGVQITVVNQKVQVVYQGSVLNNQKPQIWYYNAKTGAVKDIGYLLPPGLVQPQGMTPNAEDNSKITRIDVPDLEGLNIDASSIAPDGYEFRIGADRYSRNIFDGLFYSSRYRHEAVLAKDGRNIRLPNLNDRYYWGDTHFIGWVVSS